MTDRTEFTDCPDLPAEDLVAWLDGELSADLALRVERHVAACAACAREADLLRRSGALVAGLPRIAPRTGFDAAVVARVRAESGAPGGRILRATFPRWAAIAAAALVAIAGGWCLTLPTTAPGDLSRADEEAIARDLFVISHLDVLDAADAEVLTQLADDLDVIDAAADTAASDEGG